MRIGEKDFRIPDITFGVAYNFKQEKGIDLKQALSGVGRFDESAIVAFVSLAVDNDTDKAIDLIGEYLSEGGDFVEIIKEINQAVEESGFFQAWLRTMEKVQEMNKPKPKKKK